MPKLIDLTGQRFGNLVALEHLGRGKWKCRCDCGNECVKHSVLLRNGTSDNCGCMTGKKISERDTKHGGCGTKLYEVWKSMRVRCFSPSSKDYLEYGGRGITVCDEWQDFATFRDWALMNGYREGLSIDRINPDGGYSPSNCRWTNLGTQAWNRRHTSRQDMWKPIGAFDNDGNLVQMFKNVTGAVEWLGKESTTAPGISAVLHGQQNTAYGYRWCYLTERKIEVPHNIFIRFNAPRCEDGSPCAEVLESETNFYESRLLCKNHWCEGPGSESLVVSAFDCVSFDYDAGPNGFFDCEETGTIRNIFIEDLMIDGVVLIDKEKSA